MVRTQNDVVLSTPEKFPESQGPCVHLEKPRKRNRVHQDCSRALPFLVAFLSLTLFVDQTVTLLLQMLQRCICGEAMSSG